MQGIQRAESPIEDQASAALCDVVPPRVVLLVEDEESIRTLLTRTLGRLGWRVHNAANGAEALEVVASLPAPVSLVITDVVMPRCGGVELARRLHVLGVSAPVIFMSGYPRGATQELVNLEGGFLMKPFSMGELASAIADAFAGSSNAAA
jgi:CheY-like chemotaxis protein